MFDKNRCWNIHLVSKSVNKYRVRCRSGGALLAPSIYCRIAEKTPQKLVNNVCLLFQFELCILEARAEILEIISFHFWKI